MTEINNEELNKLLLKRDKLKMSFDEAKLAYDEINLKLNSYFDNIAQSRLEEDGKDYGTVSLTGLVPSCVVKVVRRRKIYFDDDDIVEILKYCKKEGIVAKDVVDMNFAISDATFKKWSQSMKDRFAFMRKEKHTGTTFTIIQKDDE